MPGINVADGHYVAEVGVFVCIASPHASYTDAPNNGTIIGPLICKRTGARKEIRNGTTSGGCRKRGFQEVATRGCSFHSVGPDGEK
jgi:hypothetical protein